MKSTFIKVSPFLIILSLSVSCSFFHNLFTHKHKEPHPVPIPSPQPDRLVEPEDIESQALSYYKSASIFENQYYETEKIEYAKIAIEKFEKYYNLLPNGSYAGLALLHMAELSYNIGDKSRALYELNRIKRRYDLKLKYSEEIKSIEELISQWNII